MKRPARHVLLVSAVILSAALALIISRPVLDSPRPSFVNSNPVPPVQIGDRIQISQPDGTTSSVKIVAAAKDIERIDPAILQDWMAGLKQRPLSVSDLEMQRLLLEWKRMLRKGIEDDERHDLRKEIEDAERHNLYQMRQRMWWMIEGGQITIPPP